jgi:hypothetical protein
MQGHSNEDNPRETMWLFQKQSSMFFFRSIGACPFQLMQMQTQRIQIGSVISPRQIRIFSGTHVQARHRGEVNGGILALTSPNVQAAGTA